MTFDEPISFREAVRQLAAKKLMPTSLTSAELQEVQRAILRNSVFSAQTTIEGLLDRYKSGISSIIDPKQVLRPDKEVTVTEGFNPATLRTFIKDYLGSIGYQAPEGKEGTIQDLSSDGRINLVVKTGVQTQHGAGRFIQQNKDAEVVNSWPGLAFVRFEDRKEPRGWDGANGLWLQAARRAGDDQAIQAWGNTGRMVALKSSGIWEELGNPDYVEGGLGNPYPPFAFGSGMWTEELDRKECEELGLLDEGEEAEPAEFDLGSLFKIAA